jgi:hypothetical protein
MKLAGIVVLLLVGLAAPAAAQSGGAPLTEAQWLRPDADIVAFLTQSPGECFSKAKSAQERYRVELGRVAFRSPFLLGGQAARGKLSCASCHRDGRANPDFFYDGLSGAPGTADVTSSLFSKTREDGSFNPRPIPNLVDVAEGARLDQAHGLDRIEDFIGSAVTDEFQGAPPPRSVLAGLTAYVGALRSSDCPDEPIALTPRSAMKDVTRALKVANAALSHADIPAGDFAILSAQGELGRINERFAGMTAEQEILTEFSRALGRLRPLAAVAPTCARVRLEEYLVEANRIGGRLNASKRQSLYNPAVIAAMSYRSEQP